ncbi:M28 family peptidase [Rapidithrix thailandica]|uniref:M28 family peptidase n=1 Tax=Rapidithrix thailandica TaxID=413964 RepID=A0AAW9SB22_9BACT
MKKVWIGLLAFAWSGWVSAQSTDKQTVEKYANTITKDDLKKHLSIIASDEYEGRETGEKGQKMAAKYIATHFQNIALEGPVKDNKNAYYQPFELVKSSWGDCYIKSKGGKLELLKDFVPYGNFEIAKSKMEVVFAGFGIEHENYSDYKDLDVNGKLVVVIEGEPQSEDGKYVVSGSDKKSKEGNLLEKMKLAKAKGAASIVVAYQEDDKFSKMLGQFSRRLEKPSMGFDKGKEGKENTFGLFLTSLSNAAVALNTSKENLETGLQEMNTGKSIAGKFNGKVKIKAERSVSPVISENVLGYMEGTDKKDEILVITSHYDHIGVDPNGDINNGADDDGSGTVGLLEIAEAFSKAKAEGKGPRRSILFMTVSGEEKGLLGSDFYSRNPVFPLKNTITDLNIDMIGRVDAEHKDEPNYVYIIGSDMLSSELHNLHEEAAKTYYPDFKLDYKYNSEDDPNRFYYRSDHYNFAKHNIPVIFYFNGTHEDYHKPTDTVDKIEFESLRNRARLVFVTAWELANRENRPKVDKNQ